MVGFVGNACSKGRSPAECMYLRLGIAVAACLIAGACSSIWDQQGEQDPAPAVERAQETTMLTAPEETAPQTSKEPDASESANAGPQLGEVGHVAAIGQPDMSQFTPDYWASRESYMVDVYLCAPPGRYEFVQRAWGQPMEGRGQEVREQWYGRQHGTAAGKIARLFARESTGLLSLWFTPRLSEIELMTPTETEESLERWAAGGELPDWTPRQPAGFSPIGMEWSATTMETLYDDALSGSLSGCEWAVVEHQAALAADEERRRAECERDSGETAQRRCIDLYSQAALLLVDVPPGQVAGFAKFGGIAIVSLQSAGGRLDSDEFAFIVAHELGHSILQLWHTDEASGADCDDDKWALMRSNNRCLSPPMGPNGLLDYEITCSERRLLSWRCEHEPPDDEWFDGWERSHQFSASRMGELQERAGELEAAQRRGESIDGVGGEWCRFLFDNQAFWPGMVNSIAEILDVAEPWPEHLRVRNAMEMLGVEGVEELSQLLDGFQTAADEVEAAFAEQCWPW